MLLEEFPGQVVEGAKEMDVKEKLLAKKASLEKALEEKKKASKRAMGEILDELSMYDQHPADVASELYEREKDAGIAESIELELARVNDALRRCDEGSYGRCRSCGEPIDAKRLEVLPEADLCVKCARAQQDKFTRPEEERQTDISEMTEKGEWFKLAEYDFFEEWHKKFPE